MTLTHKVKLIFCRISWWLRITEKAREHKKALEDYYYLYDLYNIISGAYLEAHRKRIDSEQTYKLKGQTELLAEILDIRRQKP